MGIHRVGPFFKTATEIRTPRLDFRKFLGTSETLATIGAITIVPTGGSHLTVPGSAVVESTKAQLQVNGGVAPQSITADVSTDELTAAAHGLTDGTMVHITGDAGCIPAPLSTTQQYFVVSATTNTFQLATCEGGTPVVLTAVETGISKVAIDYLVSFPTTTSGTQTPDAELIVSVRD